MMDSEFEVTINKERSRVIKGRGLLRKQWKRFLLASMVMTFALLPVPGWEGNSASAAMGQRPGASAVVFAVSGESDEYTMDAVVLVVGKQLRVPFTQEQKDGQKNFAEKYFAAGRKYRLLFVGGDAGNATLKKWSE